MTGTLPFQTLENNKHETNEKQYSLEEQFQLLKQRRDAVQFNLVLGTEVITQTQMKPLR